MITGKKIVLRAIEESDLDFIQKWNFDPDTTRYFSPRWPNNKTEQKKWFDAQQSNSKKKLLIVDKESKQPLGLVGIMELDHVNKNCEIGITLGEKHSEGKGYAAEAMHLALSFLFHQLNMHVVYLRVFEKNLHAVKFFEKAGFKNTGIMRDMVFKDNLFHSYIIMSILKTEFIDG